MGVGTRAPGGLTPPGGPGERDAADAPRRRWRRARIALCAAMLAAALTTLILRILGQGLGWSWRLDLLSGLAGVMAGACALAAALALLLRCRRIALLIAFLAGAHVLWMAVGRAPRGEGPRDRAIRVMTFNALGTNPHGERVLAAIESSDADLVCILEASWHTLYQLRQSRWDDERYPYRVVPEEGKEWNIVVLSRFPLTIGETRDPNWDEWWDFYNYRRVVTVHAPPERGGDFMHAMLIPSSPRNPRRWDQGNDLLETNIRILRRHYLSTGLPLVVTADLNASPTMWRTGRVRRALGLLRCKPLWGVVGTWPASNPRWKRFAIDDVFVSPGVRVASWRVIEGDTGSDHAPVVVDLILPPVAG